jgi:curved DNA-binding protein CbpA
MSEETADWYEVLQVSPRADTATIIRVFRFLAKRLHPDNRESGNPEQFNLLMEAFGVLSDPQRRAKYDARHQTERERRWRVFDQDSAVDNVSSDRLVRETLLKLLYTARRSDPEHPGLGVVHLEQLLGVPEIHLKFHIWYLRENGWVQRLESGLLAITAAGVDRVLDTGGPGPDPIRQLEAGVRAARRASPETHGANGAASRPPTDAEPFHQAEHSNDASWTEGMA